MDMSLDKFDPTVADLTALAEVAKTISITDFESKAQIEAVRQNRIVLKNARVAVEKRGKELREDANAFASAVIAKQKELIAIISPEEERLKKLEDEAETHVLRQERLRKLPERRQRLQDALVGAELFDEAVLGMDDVTFEATFSRLVNERAAVENARKEEELRIKQAELDAKEREIREKEESERRERERLIELERARMEGEERAKVEQAKKEQFEAERRRKEEAEVKDRLIREEAEHKAAAAKLEKSKKYKAFLEVHGFTDATRGDFKVEETATGYVLYKRLGEFLK